MTRKEFIMEFLIQREAVKSALSTYQRTEHGIETSVEETFDEALKVFEASSKQFSKRGIVI